MSDSQQTGNVLYYGDNLDILRRHVKNESIDLVYLDPPFKSSQDYNILFSEKNGSQSIAQHRAFEDTWHWDHVAERSYREVVERGGKTSQVLQAFMTFLGNNDMMAYLTMMAPRLIELRRILRNTGSIFLHCDSVASHYLKLLMDSIYDPRNFRNEIIWKRAQPKSHAYVRFSRAHDVILFYAKSQEAPFMAQYKEHDPEYLKKFYRFREDGTGRLYRLADLTNPNKNRPNLTYEFPKGSGTVRVWRWTEDRMKKAWEAGRIVIPENGKVACFKRFLDEMKGTPITDIWDDIEHIHGSNKESLGYPTQKPEGLLERIIETASSEGDTVLDPFCGCGTAIAVAERLHRRWIGIDITYLAIALIKNRLTDTFGENVAFSVLGEPVDINGAEALAKEDPYQFQWWALDHVKARPIYEKKGADKGIDGRLYFHDEGTTGQTKQIIFSVKAGKLAASHVRDLRGVVEREEAAIGILISFQEPTREMRKEAASAGFYHSSGWNKDYPKLQLITVKELLEGKKIEYPPSKEVDVTYKKAPKAKPGRKAENKGLFED